MSLFDVEVAHGDDRPIRFAVANEQGAVVMQMNEAAARRLASDLLSAAHRVEHPDDPLPHVFVFERVES